MEHKPLKRHLNIQPLSKDHHFTLLFCWKIRQGIKNKIAPKRIKSFVAHFWQNHMLLHFHEEETSLFAPIADDKVKRALNDHRQIKAQLTATLQADEATAVTQLTTLADLVDKHVRYEERELFPHLENILTAEQLESIGRQLQKVPAAVADDFDDAFWLQKTNSI